MTPGFHLSNKAPFITVRGTSNTVAASTSEAWGTILLDVPAIRSGKHQWSFKIDTKHRSGGIAFGLAGRNFNASSSNIGAGDNSWGFSCSGKKAGQGSGWIPYQAAFGEGDVIGLTVDFANPSAGVLEFSKNGVNLGVAFNNVVGPVIPGVCFGGRVGTVVSLLPPPARASEDSVAFSSVMKAAVVSLDASCTTATNNDRQWGSVLVAVPPVTSGIHKWSFKVNTRFL